MAAVMAAMANFLSMMTSPCIILFFAATLLRGRQSHGGGNAIKITMAYILVRHLGLGQPQTSPSRTNWAILAAPVPTHLLVGAI
jgi:hypothetical protein